MQGQGRPGQARTACGRALIALVVGSATALAQTATPTPRADVQLTVVSRTGDERIMTAAPAALAFNQVTLTEGRTIKGLLTEAGIKADAGAYTLVYEANPSLRNVDRVSAGQILWLPRLIGTGSVASVADGELVRIDSHISLRRLASARLNDAYVASALVTPKLDQLVADDARRGQMEGLLTAYRTTLENHRISQSAATAKSLAVMASEGRVVSALLTDAAGANRALSDAEATAVIEMLTEMNEIADCSKANANCDLRVKVTTKDDTGERKGYQIRSAPFHEAESPKCTAEIGCVHEFRVTSSPAVDEFPAARFKIWAVKGGVIMSEKKEMWVKQNGVNEFDLLVRATP